MGGNLKFFGGGGGGGEFPLWIKHWLLKYMHYIFFVEGPLGFHLLVAQISRV